MRTFTSGRYAAITSTVALLVALGGTGYAATQIGTNQIKNNAVTTPKIKANAINTGKVKDNSLNGNDINEGTLGQVPAAAVAGTADDAAHANNADNSAKINGMSIVPINFRANSSSNFTIGTLNGLTLRTSCAAGDETMSVITSVPGGEIGFTSVEADNLTQVGGGFDDDFQVADTFAIGFAPGSASDRQYTIRYSAADDKNVSIYLTTEDTIGAFACVISGYMIG